MKKLFFVLIGISLVMGMSVFESYAEEAAGETENSQASSVELEPITVLSEPGSQRKDLDPDSITNLYRVEKTARFGTEVFSEKDIQELKPSDVYDLLDKAVGMDLTYQGRRSPFFIRQRGGGSFTYVIDGAELPPSVNRILYKLPLSAIEQLQIVRGSTSLTLGPSIPIGASSSGSGLNTGYIIIRTKQPKKTEAILSAAVEYAEGGHPLATQESLYLGTRFGGSSSLLGGYIGGLAAKMDRPSKNSWFDGRSGEGGMINGGLRLGKFNLNLLGYYDEGRLEMQRGIAEDGTLSDVKWYYDPLRASILSTDMAMQWTPNQVSLLNLFKTRFDQNEHNESFVSPAFSERDYEEETWGAGFRHNARFGNTLIQVGGQYSNSTGFGGNCSKGYNKYDTTVWGWSASLEQSFFDGRLVFDGGYRQDTKHIDNSSSGKNESAANDDANNDVDMDPSKVFALGAHWQMIDRLALDARYYYGKQGTTGDFDMRLVGDAEPRKEEQERIEVALSADITPWFRPMVTWFDIETENAKSATSSTYELDDGTYYYYTEADELRRGLETTIKGNFGQGTSYQLSWTHMLDNERTSDGVTTNYNGVSNPRNLYSLRLSHAWRAYRANLSVKRVDEWSDCSSAKGKAEAKSFGDYTRIDANIKRDFKWRDLLLTLSLYGRNLGDKHYATRYVTGYYYDRGRTIGTELTVRY
jgi:hypothetical protein